MNKKILGIVILLLLALPLVCLAGEEEKKEEWKRYREVTAYFGGGIVYGGRKGMGGLSLRVGVEQSLSRRFSLAFSCGYFSRAVTYGNLKSDADCNFLDSNPHLSLRPPGLITQKNQHPYTRSPVREYTICFDSGLRCYIHRSPDDKEAVFFYIGLIGYYKEKVTCKFLILDTGTEEEHSGEDSLIDIPFIGYPLLNLGVGFKFQLKDNLYLETLLRTDCQWYFFNLYFGLSYRF
jgi:hypothetical protein